jgi:uncharacterized membrane protein YgaE (UPF0421/DUF939 family)
MFRSATRTYSCALATFLAVTFFAVFSEGSHGYHFIKTVLM